METTADQQTIGNYRIIRPLARGGFSETFLVENAKGKRYVIKRLNPIPSNDKATSLDLFRKECDRLKEVGHNGRIPTFIEYFEEDGMHHIVQQYIPGKTLQEEIKGRELYSESEILDLLQECLPILEFVHSHGMIHRDIKPANIIRRAIDNKLCLVDFGAAKTITETVLGKTSHTVIGSASYAAPEQMNGKVAFASDIYGLGATCLFLLTGQVPSDLYSYAEGIWVWQDTCQTSPEFASVLNKLISQATSKRYTSVRTALKDVCGVEDRIRERHKSDARKAAIQKARNNKLVKRAGAGIAGTLLVTGLGIGAWKAAPIIKTQLEKYEIPEQTKEPSKKVEEAGGCFGYMCEVKEALIADDIFGGNPAAQLFIWFIFVVAQILLVLVIGSLGLIIIYKMDRDENYATPFNLLLVVMLIAFGTNSMSGILVKGGALGVANLEGGQLEGQSGQSVNLPEEKSTQEVLKGM